MTGPEHYQAAERLVAGIDDEGRTYDESSWNGLGTRELREARRDRDLAAAAVHVGLAQTAALALSASKHTSRNGDTFGWGYMDTDISDWQRAAGSAGRERIRETRS